MNQEGKKYFGVSTKALMPDEMDTDMSVRTEGVPAALGLGYAESVTAGTLYPCRHDPLGQYPDRTCGCQKGKITAALGLGYAGQAADGAEKDWRCEKHGTTGWRGDHCRLCADLAPINKYVALENVLHRALEQASKGKGAERHAMDLSFENQPMQTISRMVGSHHGLLYQAIKKAQESTRLPTVERQVAELLGAINYLAGAVIYLESPK